MSVGLSDSERLRYARHIVLPQVGEEGQIKLLESSVLVVGAGGLGSPAMMYLAAAGVGRIGIIDDDVVESSNLQRQIIHSTSSVGESKALSAKKRFFIPEEDKWVTLKVSASALKTINKKGIASVLSEAKANGNILV